MVASDNASSPSVSPALDGLADFAVTDEELRGLPGDAKWREVDPDVLPAWVATMDVRTCPVVADALHTAVDAGLLTYPTEVASGLPEALAGFLTRRFGWTPDLHRVIPGADVLAGVMLAFQAITPTAPVVVPVPAYPPFFGAVRHTGRPVVTVPCVPDGQRHALDLDAIGRAFAAGARGFLLTNPHNPLGTCWTRDELTVLRGLADRYGARVVSDEVHAPLALPGSTFTPYATVDPHRHVTVIAASKAWNTPGLKCAQVVTGSAADTAALRRLPHVANRGTSILGVVASVAAYTRGDAWLDSLVRELDTRRAQFAALLSRDLPQVSWRPMEASYLAWVDARGTGWADPAAAALQAGRVRVEPGPRYDDHAATEPDFAGFVRVNLGTSAERLDRVVARLATAWS